jgi:AraC family transcriptional regulator of adaptative response / methylphosphotriester-DNA alkyltransferase methyltransferase
MRRRDPAAPLPVTDEQWEAISNNDAAYDGQFYYAVKTTGIFCRPSCKSRLPNRDNIGVFPNSEHAFHSGYRPCKRCKPTGQRLPDEEWIAIVTDYVDSHYKETLSLETLAHLSHGSPYHLHRTFRKVTGQTPVHYIQHVRINRAKALLSDSSPTVKEIASAVGLPNTAYFITLFKKMTGDTPEAYRRMIRQHQKENDTYDNPHDHD